jgi:hypothetical protein
MTTDISTPTTSPSTTTSTGPTASRDGNRPYDRPRRVSTETKSAPKTTEFLAYLAAVVGVLVASAVVGNDGGGDDFFRADRAWFYVVILTVGYMVSRGLAKSGSREHYDA